MLELYLYVLKWRTFVAAYQTTKIVDCNMLMQWDYLATGYLQTVNTARGKAV